MKSLKTIATIILAAVILVATSGFSVFRHSCQTEQTTELSLFIPDFNCDHGHAHSDAQGPACCSVESPDEIPACNTGDCCHTETLMVKLEIDTDLPVKFKNTTDLAVTPRMQEPLTIISEEGESNHIMVSNDLPPPLAGKDLRIFLHQLNIPLQAV